MRRKLAGLLLAAVLALVLPGCWSRYEIENLAVIGGIGVDRLRQEDRDKFLVTFNILRPSLAGGGTEAGGSRGRPAFWRFKVVGDTLADAERNLNIRAPRRVFFGQARYVIIGESLARDGISDIIDYLQRHRDIRLRTLVLVTKGWASDRMLAYPELENSLAREVQGEEAVAGPRVSKARIRDLAVLTDELITPGLDPVLARVELVTSPPTEPGGYPLSVLRFEGGGVFRIDKLVGWLDGEETRGYLLGTGQARQAVLPMQHTEHPTKDLSVLLTRSSSQIKVKVKDRRVTAAISIRAEGDLAEFHDSQKFATGPGLNGLEKHVEAEIRREVLKAVTKAQKLNADIFGFGAALHCSDPGSWKKVAKDWYRVLPDVKVTVQVKADIRRTGFVGDPYVAR